MQAPWLRQLHVSGFALCVLACLARGATSTGQDVSICHGAMSRQLASSHIQDEQCQHRVAEVYCKKLAAVEHPVPFRGNCLLDAETLASSSYSAAGHLPGQDVDAVVYRQADTVVPLGILVLVFYAHLADLVKRLVLDLWDFRHTFVLHVDPKAEVGLVNAFRSWASSSRELKSNVFVHSEVDVKRSGASLLDAELYGMRELLNLSKKWHYFLILSDSDQLVRPLSFLYRYLHLHLGESFINTEVLRGKPRSVAVECADRVHSVRMGGHESGIPTRPGLTLASGSQFVAIFRDLAEYAANDRIPQVMDVLEEVRTFASPDETFFQTLAVNTEFCTSHVRHNFHFHDTGGNFLDESSQKYTDFPTGSPPVMAEAHERLLAEVKGHQPLVFARKFDPQNTSSMALLERLALLNKREDKLSSWSSVEDGWSWAQGATAALLQSHCRAKPLGPVKQLIHSPDSVLDIAPASYRLHLRIYSDGDKACLSQHNPVALRRGKKDAFIEGELMLQERMAVPLFQKRQQSDNDSPLATAMSPLVWLRVGVGWDSANLRFQGGAAIASVTSVRKFGLHAVLHWRPEELARELQLRWTGPQGNTTYVVEEAVPPWSMISATTAPMQPQNLATLQPGWWSLDVAQNLWNSRGTRLWRKVGGRKFYLFSAENAAPLDAFDELLVVTTPQTMAHTLDT